MELLFSSDPQQPTFYWHESGILPGILPGVYSDILAGMLFICSNILSDKSVDMHILFRTFRHLYKVVPPSYKLVYNPHEL